MPEWLTRKRVPLTPEQRKALKREGEGRREIRRQADQATAEATLEAWDRLNQDQGEEEDPNDE